MRRPYRQVRDGLLMQKSDEPKDPIPENLRLAFDFFSEIGILQQLSQPRLERRMPHGISYAQFSVLSHLIRTTDGKSPSTLARILQVPRPNMTNTLSGLEKRGHIEIKPNPRDGRGKLIFLTEAGQHVREQAIVSIIPEFVIVSKRFDFSELASFMPVLGKLREVMDLYRDEDTDTHGNGLDL